MRKNRLLRAPKLRDQETRHVTERNTSSSRGQCTLVCCRHTCQKQQTPKVLCCSDGLGCVYSGVLRKARKMAQGWVSFPWRWQALPQSKWAKCKKRQVNFRNESLRSTFEWFSPRLCSTTGQGQRLPGMINMLSFKTFYF